MNNAMPAAETVRNESTVDCDECLELLTPAERERECRNDDADCVGDPPRYVRTNRRVCDACRAEGCEWAEAEYRVVEVQS